MPRPHQGGGEGCVRPGDRMSIRERQRAGGGFLVLAIFILLTNAAAAPAPPPAEPCGNGSVGPACVAGLVRDLLAVRSVNLSLAVSSPRPAIETAVESLLTDCLSIELKQPLRPVNLRLADQARGRGAELLAQLLLQQTGFEANVTFADIPDIVPSVFADLTAPPPHPLLDGYMIDPSAVVELSGLGALAPLEDFVASDDALQWSDVLPFVRQVATIYDGHLVGVPISGQVSVLYYRKDVLAAAGAPVPNTWDELLYLASALNGSDFNGDNVTDYALCWQVVNCLEAPVVMGQIAAPYLQSQGTRQGWVFDPSDLRLLLNSEAMVHAMGLFRSLQALTNPAASCELVHMPFLRGECAFTVKWSEQFKVTEQFVPELHGRLGVAPLPGATSVLDRGTWRMAPCTNDTCPYATPARDLFTGNTVLINRAPYFGFGGFAGSARNGIGPDYTAAVYRYFANLAAPTISWSFLLDAGTPVGPFRFSHVDPANLHRWAERGYNINDTAEFLAAWTANIQNPNVALDIRIQGGSLYNQILTEAVTNIATTSIPIPDIHQQLLAKFAAVLAGSGNFTTVLAQYRAGLGYSAPAPPPQPSAPPSSPHGGSSSPATLAPIIVPVVLGTMLLTLLAHWVRNRSRRLDLLGTPLPPKPRADTTVLVATLPDLPALLRELPEPVMHRSLSLYLSTMRRLLRKHHGYEAVACLSTPACNPSASASASNRNSAEAGAAAGPGLKPAALFARGSWGDFSDHPESTRSSPANCQPPTGPIAATWGRLLGKSRAAGAGAPTSERASGGRPNSHASARRTGRGRGSFEDTSARGSDARHRLSAAGSSETPVNSTQELTLNGSPGPASQPPSRRLLRPQQEQVQQAQAQVPGAEGVTPELPLTAEGALAAGPKATAEGWSLVCAFRTPRDALAFGVAAQQALMAAEWPAELLQHPACRPLYAVPAAVLSRGLGAGDRSSAGSTHLGASGHGRHAHHSRPHRTSMSTAADGMPAAAGAGAGQRPGGRRRDSEGGGLTAQTSRHLGSPCPSSAGVAPVPLHAGPSRVVRRLMMRRRVLDLFHAGPGEDDSEASVSGPSMTDLGTLLRAAQSVTAGAPPSPLSTFTGPRGTSPPRLSQEAQTQGTAAAACTLSTGPEGTSPPRLSFELQTQGTAGTTCTLSTGPGGSPPRLSLELRTQGTAAAAPPPATGTGPAALAALPGAAASPPSPPQLHASGGAAAGAPSGPIAAAAASSAAPVAVAAVLKVPRNGSRSVQRPRSLLADVSMPEDGTPVSPRGAAPAARQYPNNLGSPLADRTAAAGLGPQSQGRPRSVTFAVASASDAGPAAAAATSTATRSPPAIFDVDELVEPQPSGQPQKQLALAAPPLGRSTISRALTSRDNGQDGPAPWLFDVADPLEGTAALSFTSTRTNTMQSPVNTAGTGAAGDSGSRIPRLATLLRRRSEGKPAAANTPQHAQQQQVQQQGSSDLPSPALSSRGGLLSSGWTARSTRGTGLRPQGSMDTPGQPASGPQSLAISPRDLAISPYSTAMAAAVGASGSGGAPYIISPATTHGPGRNRRHISAVSVSAGGASRGAGGTAGSVSRRLSYERKSAGGRSVSSALVSSAHGPSAASALTTAGGTMHAGADSGAVARSWLHDQPQQPQHQQPTNARSGGGVALSVSELRSARSPDGPLLSGTGAEQAGAGNASGARTVSGAAAAPWRPQVVRMVQYYRAAYKVVTATGQVLASAAQARRSSAVLTATASAALGHVSSVARWDEHGQAAVTASTVAAAAPGADKPERTGQEGPEAEGPAVAARVASTTSRQRRSSVPDGRMSLRPVVSGDEGEGGGQLGSTGRGAASPSGGPGGSVVRPRKSMSCKSILGGSPAPTRGTGTSGTLRAAGTTRAGGSDESADKTDGEAAKGTGRNDQRLPQSRQQASCKLAGLVGRSRSEARIQPPAVARGRGASFTEGNTLRAKVLAHVAEAATAGLGLGRRSGGIKARPGSSDGAERKPRGSGPRAGSLRRSLDAAQAAVCKVFSGWFRSVTLEEEELRELEEEERDRLEDGARALSAGGGGGGNTAEGGTAAAAAAFDRSSAGTSLWGEVAQRPEFVGVLVQRGLRACIGLHTGVKPQNVSYSRTAKRMAYGGPCLRVARAVAAAAYGTASRVLLSGACFKQLGAGSEAERGVTVLNVGEFVLDRPFPVQNPLNLYMPLPPSLGPALALHGRPYGVRQRQGGVMEAPVGDATIVFTNVVGISTLMAWDVAEARSALALLQRVACRRLAACGGYLVELVEGLVLAAFTDPEAAVRFGLLLLSELLEADWSPVLLSHELCEEVLVQDTRAGAGVAVGSGAGIGAGRGWGHRQIGAHAPSALGALRQEAREQLASRAASLTQQRPANLPPGDRRTAMRPSAVDYQQYLEPAPRTSSRRASLPEVVTRTLDALAAAAAPITASGRARGAECSRRGSFSAPRDRSFSAADAREAGVAGGGGGREAGEPNTRMSLLPWALGELRMGLGRLRLIGRSSHAGNHTELGGAGAGAAGPGGKRTLAGGAARAAAGGVGVLAEELEDGQVQQRMASFQRAAEGSARAANTRVLYRGLRLRVGIDAGPVKAEINAVTGRVSYRGRAMNRAARIAAKAPAGQLWCSDDVWRSCCSSTAAVDGRASNNGNNRTSGSGGTAGRTSFTLTAAPRRNAGDISEGHTAGDELYDGRDRRSHVSQLGEYGRDSAVQKQYSVAGRYMGRHVLKGVSGPMDLWHCRLEVSTPAPAPQALAGQPRGRDRDKDSAGVAPDTLRPPSHSDSFSAARAVMPAAGAALQGGSSAWRKSTTNLGAAAGDAAAGAKAKARAGASMISASQAEREEYASGSAAFWVTASGAFVQSSPLFAGPFGGQALGARAPVVPAPALNSVPPRSGRQTHALVWESVEEAYTSSSQQSPQQPRMPSPDPNRPAVTPFASSAAQQCDASPVSSSPQHHASSRLPLPYTPDEAPPVTGAAATSATRLAGGSFRGSRLRNSAMSGAGAEGEGGGGVGSGSGSRSHSHGLHATLLRGSSPKSNGGAGSDSSQRIHTQPRAIDKGVEGEPKGGPGGSAADGTQLRTAARLAAAGSSSAPNRSRESVSPEHRQLPTRFASMEVLSMSQPYGTAPFPAAAQLQSAPQPQHSPLHSSSHSPARAYSPGGGEAGGSSLGGAVSTLSCSPFDAHSPPVPRQPGVPTMPGDLREAKANIGRGPDVAVRSGGHSGASWADTGCVDDGGGGRGSRSSPRSGGRRALLGLEGQEEDMQEGQEAQDGNGQERRSTANGVEASAVGLLLSQCQAQAHVGQAAAGADQAVTCGPQTLTGNMPTAAGPDAAVFTFRPPSQQLPHPRSPARQQPGPLALGPAQLPRASSSGVVGTEQPAPWAYSSGGGGDDGSGVQGSQVGAQSLPVGLAVPTAAPCGDRRALQATAVEASVEAPETRPVRMQGPLEQ